MTREEQELCRGLRAGSPKAYRQLLDRYTPYVWAVVRNIAGEKLSRAELEDLAAEVFAGIWRGREGLREEGSLRGYLAASARNAAWDAWNMELGYIRDRAAVMIFREALNRISYTFSAPEDGEYYFYLYHWSSDPVLLAQGSIAP